MTAVSPRSFAPVGAAASDVSCALPRPPEGRWRAIPLVAHQRGVPAGHVELACMRHVAMPKVGRQFASARNQGSGCVNQAQPPHRLSSPDRAVLLLTPRQVVPTLLPSSWSGARIVRITHASSFARDVDFPRPRHVSAGGSRTGKAQLVTSPPSPPRRQRSERGASAGSPCTGVIDDTAVFVHTREKRFAKTTGKASGEGLCYGLTALAQSLCGTG